MSTTSRPVPLWASATPSEMPIWVAVPSALPGCRYGRSKSQSLERPLLQRVRGEHPVLVLDGLPDLERQPAGRRSATASQSCPRLLAATRPGRIVAQADVGPRAAAMRASRPTSCRRTSRRPARSAPGPPATVSARIESSVSWIAPVVHRPAAELEVAEADLDELAVRRAVRDSMRRVALSRRVVGPLEVAHVQRQHAGPRRSRTSVWVMFSGWRGREVQARVAVDDRDRQPLGQAHQRVERPRDRGPGTRP